jgi:endonuclease G
MDPKHKRLADFVRELNRRDGRGPADFPIADNHLEPRHGNLERFVLPSRQEAPSANSLEPAEAPTSPSVAHAPVLTPEAAETFAKTLDNQELSAGDIVRLESIILPALRPAFDIQNETYAQLPGDWDLLNRHRTAIEPILRAVGRLQLIGHPSYTLVGTAFVCGPNTIVTNRHVAQIFVQGLENGQQLTYLPGVTCAMDMLAEVGSDASAKLNITRPVSVSSKWDIAVLHIESLPPNIQPLPLASSSPAAIEGGVATIVGYPSYDSYESFVDQANIFRAVFDRKRLQPGKLNGRVDVPSLGQSVSAIAHDCSTLGGNSGSVLVSVETAEVVGIHFSGVTHLSNYAVPSWELVNDPALRGQGIAFV